MGQQGSRPSKAAAHPPPVAGWGSAQVNPAVKVATGEARDCRSDQGAARALTSDKSAELDLQPIYSFLQAASALMHAMQAERGASTVLCASKGEQFRSNLQLFRAVTDESWERLTQTSLAHKGSILLSFHEIEAMRLRIDSHMHYLECIKMFTILVDRLLVMISERLEPLKSTVAGAIMSNYITFLSFKEYNGRERASIAGALADHSGQKLRYPAVYAFYVKIKGAQQALGTAFLLTASRRVSQMYCKEVPAVPQEVATLMEGVNISVEAANEAMEQVTADQWFKVMSSRMDLLEKMEQLIQKDMFTELGYTDWEEKVNSGPLASTWEKDIHAVKAGSRPSLENLAGKPTYVDVSSGRGANNGMTRVAITGKIGEGMAGPIYEGLYKDKRVAIKMCSTVDEKGNPVEDKADILREFVREVSVISVMQHPNVLGFVGASLKPPRYAMVLELMDNGNVWELLRSQPTSLNFFHLAIQMAKGLQYIHEVSGLLHRDLKTPNLLLNSKGELKIADFGLCCLGDEGQSNQVMEVGTLRWMAPEILLHQSYSLSADVFSIGIILWEMLTKQVPFVELQRHGRLSKELMVDAAREQLRPTFPQGTPSSIRNIINSCWDPRAVKRPSIGHVVQLLEQAQSGMKASDKKFLSCVHPDVSLERFKK